MVCILIGVRIHRPSDPPAGTCWPSARLAFAGGDSFEQFTGPCPTPAAPTPTWTNACYLLGYLLTIAAVVRLGRDPNQSGRREDYADAAIISLGALAISWQFLINSYVHDAALSTFGKSVVMAYPAMDVALSSSCSIRSCSGRPTALPPAPGRGPGGHGGRRLRPRPPGPARRLRQWPDRSTPLFLLAYVLIGAAALHPSVAEGVPVAPKPTPSIYRRDTNGRHRIPSWPLPASSRRASSWWPAASVPSVNVPVMSALCVAVFALIYLRMMWLIGQITGQTNEIEVHAHALEASHRQRDALEADLRHLAFHDELTGLANRALLHDRVEHALASAPRSGRSVALCFGDLDGFKTVNDTLGHHVGDSVLVRASRLLSSIVRPGDTVARLGGDEFAVLMVDVERPAGGRRLRPPHRRRCSATPPTSRATRSGCRSASAWPTASRARPPNSC